MESAIVRGPSGLSAIERGVADTTCITLVETFLLLE